MMLNAGTVHHLLVHRRFYAILMWVKMFTKKLKVKKYFAIFDAWVNFAQNEKDPTLQTGIFSFTHQI
jgi:hypothetical protein